MTVADLAAIQARRNAIRGPWRAWHRSDGSYVDISEEMLLGHYAGEMTPEQAEFIAHSLADIDTLLAEVKRLMVVVRRVREELHTTDQLLETRNRLLKRIPTCSEHGDECVPHAEEWVDRAKEALKAQGERIADLVDQRDRLKKEVLSWRELHGLALNQAYGD